MPTLGGRIFFFYSRARRFLGCHVFFFFVSGSDSDWLWLFRFFICFLLTVFFCWLVGLFVGLFSFLFPPLTSQFLPFLLYVACVFFWGGLK